ncbi:MAG: hypothetical protein ACI3XZ_08140, partial [Butyricicoccus sp.]
VEKTPGLRCLTRSRCTEIGEHTVTYADADGNAHEIEADTVILAAGMRAKTDEAMAYASAGKQFFAIGDCAKMGNLQKAVRSAYDIAMTF